MLEGIQLDLMSALRALRRQPAFAIVAGLTLAVGIGAATAMFSVLHGVLLRPLPVRDQGSIVVLSMHDRRNLSAHLPIRYATFRDLSENSQVFTDVAAVHNIGASAWLVRDGDRVWHMQGTLVSGHLFDVLGASPVLGRTLTSEDDVPGAPSVAVLSHAAWRRYFGGDAAVIGRSLRTLGRLYTVVGVMAEGLEFPRGTELWAPIVAFDPTLLSDPTAGWLDVVGRLRPGATPREGETEVAHFVRRTPASVDVDRSITARLLADVIVGDMRSRLNLLAAAVALVLLIACGNVAMLMIGRGTARAREVAVQNALGAGKWRIVRLVLVESVALAMLGGVAGVLAANWLVRILISLAPPGLPRLEAVRVDTLTLLFAAGVSSVAVVLSGLAPAIQAIRGNTAAILQMGARTVAAGWRRHAGRRLLMTAQVALALTVLVSASLLVRSLARLQALDLGFPKDRLAIARIVSDDATDKSTAAYLTAFEALRSELRSMPGVAGVIPLDAPPFSGAAGLDLPMVREGGSEKEGAGHPVVNVEIVSEDFFDVFGIPVRRGRVFTRTDDANAPRVIVVNEALARMVWPGDDPINRSARLGTKSREVRMVIGVVGDTRYRELTTPRPTVYVPLRQTEGAPAFLAVRTSIEPASLLPPIRRAIEDNSRWRVAWLATMEELLAEPLARPRFSTVLLATFAVIAVMLAAVGVYSVLALFVRQRTHELGVRMALGAEPAAVRRMVLWQGMQVAVVGAGLGLAVAVLATRTLEALLFDITPTDPLTLSGAAALILLIVGAASYIPARRATHVSPIIALRSE
jgi:putative ABC transport system permease protein